MSKTTSPTKESSDLKANEPNQNMISSQSLEEENAQLRKQLRVLEADQKTSKALLEQKIELLESQISGFQDRETSLKRMNETIMFALNDMNSKDYNPLVSKATKELELATEHHNKEMQEFRHRTNEFIKNLETENKRMKESSDENEMRLKELTIHFEKAQLGFNQAINDLEQEKTLLEAKLRKIDEEKLQSKELSEYEMLVKTNELKMSNEREKEEHRKELQKVKEAYDKSIQEIKTGYENEKRNLEGKVNRLQESLSQETAKKDATSLNELKSKYQKEVQHLKDVINQMDVSRGKEIDELRSQRDQANEKVEKLESQLKKLKVTLKNSQTVQEQNNKLLKEKLDKAKSVMEHGESLVEENKKHQQKLVEMKAIIKKLETSEQALKDLIQEKDAKLNEDRMEFKKMQQREQKRLSQSVQDTHSSQSSQQNRSRRQSVVNTLPLEDSVGSNTKREVQSLVSNSTAALNPTELQSTQYSQESPTKEENLLEPIKVVSKGQSRSVSPAPADLTSSKYSRSSADEATIQKVESESKQELTNLKRTTSNKEAKARKEEIGIPKTKVVNSRTPLETSFADHGFTVHTETEVVLVESSKVEKGKGKQDKSFTKEIDVDTMPINYNEFVKRSQRSKKIEEGQEVETTKNLRDSSEEPKLETVENEAGLTLFFTTQDENQPLFGTSHFVFEGNQRAQGEQLQSELSQIRRRSMGERRGGNDEDFEKRATGFNAELDIEDLVELGEMGDLSRVSVSYNNRKGSWNKSAKEELETKPSLMNPLHSVYESTNMMEAFQDPQASVDFLSSNTRSVMEKNREREKVFSSRDSLSSASVSRGQGNGSRQKIEGRLKDLEWKLKEMELKNQGLRVEKDKVQFEFEKLMVELNEKKAESEGMRRDTSEPWDEKKEEKEIALKNEIKFLINKLLKVKNKLEKQSEELNVTKSTNLLGQSQINFSMCQGQGRKDFSRENILGGLSNVSSSQIRERENWNPMQMSSNINLQASQNLRKSIGGEPFNMTTQLNASVTKLENYRVTERGTNKNSLGVAIENFAKNVRSRSNARYDHNRDSQNQNISLNYNVNKGGESNVNSATTRTHRSKGPLLPRPEDMGAALGSLMNREVLRPINNQNYEASNVNSSMGFEGNSSYLYQKRYNR